LIDLAIIGGGPAGTAAALEARRHGLAVLVMERERFPRDKVCGEFVSAESVPMLKEEIPAVIERAAIIRRAEFVSRRGGNRGFQLPAPARGLSRRAMDEALWRAAAHAGAEMRQGEAVRRVFQVPESSGGGWEVETESGTMAAARWLLVACGRWWRIEGLDSPARESRRESAGHWLGAKAHFTGVRARHAVEMYYFPGGYCGLAPVEGGAYNACCLVHRGVVRETASGAAKDFAAWIRAVARHRALDERLHGAVQQGETVTTAPVRPARRRAASGGVLFAGDAAGFLDPFTGDGISMALHSGRLAVEELAKELAVPSPDCRSVTRAYAARLNKSVKRSYAVAGLLRALVRAPAALQDAAAAAIPWVGTRLLADTRWRSSREAAPSVPEF
jgi:flavin-dependent dehydrogenase